MANLFESTTSDGQVTARIPFLAEKESLSILLLLRSTAVWDHSGRPNRPEAFNSVISLPSVESDKSQFAPPVCDITVCLGWPSLIQAEVLNDPLISTVLS
jgi:hypothetical protein